MQATRVQTLVRKLRSHMLHGIAKKNETNFPIQNIQFSTIHLYFLYILSWQNNVTFLILQHPIEAHSRAGYSNFVSRACPSALMFTQILIPQRDFGFLILSAAVYLALMFSTSFCYARPFLLFISRFLLEYLAYSWDLNNGLLGGLSWFIKSTMACPYQNSVSFLKNIYLYGLNRVLVVTCKLLVAACGI